MRRQLLVVAVVAPFTTLALLAVAAPAAAEAPPAPPFSASVIVVQPSWDYENVALAYDVLPADGAPYGVGEVTSGPSCMVPPVPYYVYDETSGGDTPVAPGPGTGRYPDDPAANYALWEARGGPPGEYVVVVRWQNYCFRPDQPAPSGDELFPQEVAHPQGQPVDVSVSVAVYAAGQTTPSSMTILGGVVIAGADRPANEKAVEIGRVILPPTTVTEPQPEAGGGVAAVPTGSSESGASPVEPAPEASVADPDEAPATDEEKGTDAEIAIGLLVLMLVALGVSIAVILSVVFLRTRRERIDWAKEQPEREPRERWAPEAMAERPPTHVAGRTPAWPRPGHGEEDVPYPVTCEGPVRVLETRGEWSEVVDSDGWVYWVASSALTQGPSEGARWPARGT